MIVSLFFLFPLLVIHDHTHVSVYDFMVVQMVVHMETQGGSYTTVK